MDKNRRADGSVSRRGSVAVRRTHSERIIVRTASCFVLDVGHRRVVEVNWPSVVAIDRTSHLPGVTSDQAPSIVTPARIVLASLLTAQTLTDGKKIHKQKTKKYEQRS